ncbi:MAG: iron ABC transporter permease [Rhizobiaceae bacterium]|nr:iron ABC transporter permease [Rhizobiaceae bacterium]MCV0406090.1 iron ABC transporter permease [Rhizobiaceae bacterium]
MTAVPAEARGPARAPKRVRRPRHWGAVAIAALVAVVVAVPVVTLVGIALSGDGSDWPHLAENVLPRSLRDTLHLLVLTAAGTVSIGVVSAWLVVAFDFPFRRVFAWALVLPLAVPTYLAAYAFGEFFHFTGPVQSLLREAAGFQTSRDYWFPDIRSTTGAAIVLSAVLYPYVYLTTRIVFLLQGRGIADVARTLGAGPARVLVKVLLPVARPAIVAGLALVMMEAINDIGAAEYLGVRTLTLSVYSTWLNRGSLEGAAQIALVMLVLVAGLIAAEQWGRRTRRFHAHRATHLKARPPRVSLGGLRAALAVIALLLPVAAGFGIPLWVFGGYVAVRLEQFADPALHAAFATTVSIATLTALVTIAAALLLLYALRVTRSGLTALLVRIGSVGYALPGTILGLGLLFSLASLDNHVDALAREHFGVSTGLLFSGSITAVVLACSIRFLALAEGAIRSGIEKLPPHLDEAARSLGRAPYQAAAGVVLPLLGPAILSAGVLVFVDTAKELSATILLRPFGFNTLATFVYENASRGVVEDGAAAALLIIVTALAPVALLSGALSRDREA